MDFNLTGEQEQLDATVQRFVAREYAFETRKKIRASPEGMSREIWSRLAELGLLAVEVPEEQGGLGAGAVETMLAMNGVGRGLLLEPYLESAVLATVLLRELGSPAQRDRLLPQLAAGELIAVPALGEARSRDDLHRVACAARRDGDGFVLAGEKAAVAHAPAAQLLLVSARTSGEPDDESGVSLFLVRRDAPGVELRPYPTLDGRRAADVSLREVRLPGDALLGPLGGALPGLSFAGDTGVSALCAEAVGALQALFDATVEYLKTRKQFGVPIGKFQALQHRLADMLIHLEQARSMSFLAALRASEPDGPQRRRDISAAKVLVGQACRFVGQQAVQLHGGMGMTDELHVSHFFKRLTVIELSLGDGQHHLERFLGSGSATSGETR